MKRDLNNLERGDGREHMVGSNSITANRPKGYGYHGGFLGSQSPSLLRSFKDFPQLAFTSSHRHQQNIRLISYSQAPFISHESDLSTTRSHHSAHSPGHSSRRRPPYNVNATSLFDIILPGGRCQDRRSAQTHGLYHVSGCTGWCERYARPQ